MVYNNFGLDQLLYSDGFMVAKWLPIYLLICVRVSVVGMNRFTCMVSNVN